MKTEISNKEKLITIFMKTLPDLAIDDVIIVDSSFVSIIDFIERFSIRLYKKTEPYTEYHEDDNSADYYIEYLNTSEAYMAKSRMKGRNGFSNLQFVSREPLTTKEFNDLINFTNEVLATIGKSFGEASIDGVYERLTRK